jgi:hypothetical protein
MSTRAEREHQVPGLLATAAGKKVIDRIAEHARSQLHVARASDDEGLVSWESVSDYGAFKITVRCDYGYSM